MDDLLVEVNDKKMLCNESPIGFVNGITTNYCILVHRSSYTVMMNVGDICEFFDEINYSNDDILFIEMFVSELTSKKTISKVKSICEKYGIVSLINSAFISTSKDRTIGYDYNMKQYFSVGIEYGETIFRLEKGYSLVKTKST